jgi:glycogen(starch) synthase
VNYYEGTEAVKVLFWTPLFLPDIGGIQLISSRHIASLRERNYDFVVLTSHGREEAPDESRCNGVTVYRFPVTTALEGRNLRLVREIQKRVVSIKESFKPDLVHINFGGPAPVSYFHLKTAGVCPAPLFLALHGSVRGLSGSSDTILGQVLHAADWTTACSAAMLQDASHIASELSSRSSVVYYGLPEPGIQPEPLSFDQPNILCLGRLVTDKGFDLAITAIAALFHRYPRVRLIIAGGGPARLALEQQVAALQLNRIVEFVGEVAPPEVLSLINKATVVLVPSRWREAFGLVVLEAAQMARPVVATRVGGLPEAVIHEQTGLLVEKENSQALAEAVAFLLDHPDIATRMGREGRERALNQFSWKRYVEAYDALYRSLVQ